MNYQTQEFISCYEKMKNEKNKYILDKQLILKLD